ncbi:MAG: hypothetical protein PVH55_08345 [Desulfobacterales bacterium]
MEPMLKNINYNLMETITIISKSLYRYDKYMEDASECESCQKIWSEIRANRQKELKMMLRELKAHVDEGKAPLE